MSRKPGDSCRFRQRDLKEAIKAARAAGLEDFRIEISKQGTISLVPTKPGEPAPKGDEWDDDL
jgi:hypothetical protein